MINFNSGPASLPEEVLKEASEAILNYNNSGLSILEIPHRGSLFNDILKETKQLAKSLLDLGDDYDILWIQGGGRLQFSMIPMNFLAEGETAGFIISGHWSKDAMNHAKNYGNTVILGSSEKDNFKSIPEFKNYKHDLAFAHITTNNTIYGTQFFEFPKYDAPLIADMSSELFSRRINYKQFDLIYAVAQKNIGPAGVTLVAIKKSLLEKQKRNLAPLLSYKEISKYNSVVNTPPVFAIYCSLLMMRWTKNLGWEEIESRNNYKAELLYHAIDHSSIFEGIAAKKDRSQMNICFRIPDKQLEEKFIEFALRNNITGIEGHRKVGGLRVALYNAIEPKSVEILVDLMRQFEQDNI